MTTLGARVVIFLTVAAVALIGAGVVLGRYFETPEEASLRQPTETVAVTDPLRSEVLEESLVVRGALAPTTRASPRLADGVLGRIVTAVRIEPGVELRPGQVLLEVEGRPVIALTGNFPAWRNFTQSAEGPDVSQLQSALAEVGFYEAPDDVAGMVGHRTLNAIRALYQSVGYEPPPWSDVPSHEFVFVPADLRFVERSAVAVGDALAADAITLASGSRVFEADLSIDQRQALVPGVTISVADSSGSVVWSSTVERVSELPRPEGGSGPNTAILARDQVPDAMVGEQILEVTLASTERPVLSAAASAVHVAENGDLFVVRLDGNQETVIPVTVGVVTAARIEVEPVTPGALRQGDSLVLNPDR